MSDFTLALAVGQVGAARYSLVTQYDEADPLNATGMVYATVGEHERAQTRCVLNTGHPIDTMWVSPRGALWIGSADGYMFTTAPLGWPASTGADFSAMDSGLVWQAIRIPILTNEGHAPIVTALHGLDDLNVFAGTSTGNILRCAAGHWAEMTVSAPANGPIDTIVGNKPDALYAMGYCDAVLHLEGEAWTALPVDAARGAIVTGAAILPDGVLLGCTNRGDLFELSGQTSRIIANATDKLSGMVWLGDRAILAGERVGAWEYRPGSGLHELRATFAAVGVRQAGGSVCFITSEQPNGPGFVVYEPGAELWYRWILT